MKNSVKQRSSVIIILALITSISLFILSNYMEFQLMSVLPRAESLAMANYLNKGLVAIFLLVAISAGYSILAEKKLKEIKLKKCLTDRKRQDKINKSLR